MSDDDGKVIPFKPTKASTNTLTKRCSRIKNDGQQCKAWAIRGATVCRTHGGSNPRVQRKALVRATLHDWGLTDEIVDPGMVLLRLVSQSSRRASYYSELLRQAYEAADNAGEQSPFEAPRGILALVGKTYRTTQDGDTVQTGEAIRALVVLEANERKMLKDFAATALAAGLAERQVRVAEQTGNVIVGAILHALNRAGLAGPALLDAQNAASDYLLEHGG